MLILRSRGLGLKAESDASQPSVEVVGETEMHLLPDPP